MTEIKNKLWLNDEEIAEIEGSMGRPGFSSTWSYATISNLLKDRASLITTIESLQGDIETLKFDKKKLHELYNQHMAESVHRGLEIESLKVITELAVKGLKEIQSITLGANPTRGFLMQNIVDISETVADTLSEIARIQNETP